MKQRTIKKKVNLLGIGLHKGQPINVSLEPLDANSGIIFYRADEGVSIPLSPQSVVSTQLATVIGRDNVTIFTIEHFLSALFGYGIDNLLVTIHGDEMPIMDGSSIAFCMLLEEAGIREQKAPKKFIYVKKEIEVRQDHKYAKITPYNGLQFDFKITFDHPVIKTQKKSFSFSLKNYKAEIARARTFGFLHEVQYLRSKGLALGGSLQNAIVLDEKKVLNSEGLRFKDEFVRHKILDAIGDMMVLGMPLIGKYESHAGSHNLNHLLTLELLKDKSNYEIIEAKLPVTDESMEFLNRNIYAEESL